MACTTLKYLLPTTSCHKIDGSSFSNSILQQLITVVEIAPVILKNIFFDTYNERKNLVRVSVMMNYFLMDLRSLGWIENQ